MGQSGITGTIYSFNDLIVMSLHSIFRPKQPAIKYTQRALVLFLIFCNIFCQGVMIVVGMFARCNVFNS